MKISRTVDENGFGLKTPEEMELEKGLRYLQVETAQQRIEELENQFHSGVFNRHPNLSVAVKAFAQRMRMESQLTGTHSFKCPHCDHEIKVIA
jgi:hypothetical protein